MADCVFCRIVAGRAPAHRVLEDDHAVAFLDIRPAAPGHTLVVPRMHVRDIWEISEDCHNRVAATVWRVAALLGASLAADGVNVKHNTGEAAGQDVFHFHVHVIPRRRDVGLRPARHTPPVPDGDLARVLARITADR